MLFSPLGRAALFGDYGGFGVSVVTCVGHPVVFPLGEEPRVRSTCVPLIPVGLIGGFGMAGACVTLVSPLWLASCGGHPFGVCDAVSFAGRFWPARLLSSRLGGGEVSGVGGMGRGVGRSRGRVGRVPEEQPSASGLGLAAHK